MGKKQFYFFPLIVAAQVLLLTAALSAQGLIETVYAAEDQDSALIWFERYINTQGIRNLADSHQLYYGELLYESDQLKGAIEVLDQLHQKDPELLQLTIAQQRDLHEALYNCHYDQYNNRTCLEHINRFKALVLLEDSPDTLELSKVAYWSGNVYRDMGFHEKAVDYYLEDIRLLRAEGSETAQSYLEGSYQNLGVCYHDRGEKKQALEYYNASKEITINNLGYEHEDVLTLYNNIALVYAETGELEKSLQYFDSVNQIQDKLFPDKWAYIPSRTHKNLGFTYWDMDSIKKARYHFDEAMLIRRKIYGEIHPKVANMYAVDGDWYFETKEFSKAIEAFKRAFFIYDQLYEPTDKDRLSQVAAIGQSLTEINEINEAESWYALGLDALGLADYIEHPSSELLLQSDFPMHYGTIYLLTEMAVTAFKKYKLSGSFKSLEKANAYYNNLIDQLEAIRINSSNAADKQSLIQENLDVYEQAIEAAYSAYLHFDKLGNEQSFYIDQIINIAESSRAILLTEHRNIALLNLEGNVPPELLEKEIFLRNRLRELRNHPDDKSALIFSTTVTYDSLVSAMQRDYPDYYKLRFTGSQATLARLQNALNPNQSFIEYFVGDSAVYIIHLTADTSQVLKRSGKHLVKNILKVQDALVHYFTKPFEAEKGLKFYDNIFKESAYKLHCLLIDSIPALQNDIIIIPHKELAYLPFELLVTHPPKEIATYPYANYPILLDKHNISYNYTALLFLELNDENEQNPASSVATFVPNFKNGATYGSAHTSIKLGSLKSALKEALDIKKRIKHIRIFKNKHATRDNFIEQSASHRHMHVCSHAILNDDYPTQSFIAFNKGSDTLNGEDVLYMTDVYQEHFPLDMLVLSACQTASGALRPGAGLSSMSMAFTQSGVRSLVTSLWPVNDEYSAEFMTSYYLHLSKGFPKDHALRASKLDLKAKNVHPFYWAGFILMGNTVSIDFADRSNHMVWYILIGLVILGLVGLIMYRLISSSQSI